MPPTETRVLENQLVTSWPKEQFSKEYCKTEEFWTYSGIAGQKCLHGSPNAFVSVRMAHGANQGNHKTGWPHWMIWN